MRLPRHKLCAAALAARQNAHQHGREGRQRSPVNFRRSRNSAGFARRFLRCGRTFRAGVSAKSASSAVMIVLVGSESAFSDLGNDIACLLDAEAACCGTSLKMLRSYLSQRCFVFVRPSRMGGLYFANLAARSPAPVEVVWGSLITSLNDASPFPLLSILKCLRSRGWLCAVRAEMTSASEVERRGALSSFCAHDREFPHW